MSKRDFNGNKRPPQDGGRFQSMFGSFRDELDEHYARKERVVKVSRDVTSESKKIIFALQRVKQLNKDFPPNIQQDVSTRMAEINKLIQSVNADLQGINRYRYASQLKCLEELVEALSFSHYLRHQTLVTPSEAQAATPALPLTYADFMYGVFDLFGELMRFATVTTAQKGELVGDHGRTILSDMQELGFGFEMLPEVRTKDFRFKMQTMRQSVVKVEKLGYGLSVRGSERPKGWVPDMKDDGPPNTEE